MIIGIGIDIVKIERIERMSILYGERFINRIFTKSEKEYCSGKTKYESFAARLAAKEAMFKAIGRGWSECGFTSVEVVSDNRGKPFINLNGFSKTIAEELGVQRIFLSMTHDGGVSAAVIVLEG
ncbi:MAG: holo-ACP synthase [Candidatus Latescibacterota bacterium]